MKDEMFAAQGVTKNRVTHGMLLTPIIYAQIVCGLTTHKCTACKVCQNVTKWENICNESDQTSTKQKQLIMTANSYVLIV